jgi:hypothetical protein
MHTTTDTDPPPAPERLEATTSCPDCGAPTRSVWRRDHRGVLREQLVCTSCTGVVRYLPDRPAGSRTAQYVGWYRSHKRAPFEPLAEGEDYSDCLNRLLDFLERENRRGGDSVILPCGQDANRTASARTRAGR